MTVLQISIVKTVYFLFCIILIPLFLSNTSFAKSGSDADSTTNFNSGITTTWLNPPDLKSNPLICGPGYQYVKNVEGNRYACVTADTANSLYLRGWSGNLLHGVTVYIMKQNSTGDIEIKYNPMKNGQNYTLSPAIYDDMGKVTDASNMTVTANHVMLQNHSTTVKYSIVSHNATGIYWLKVDTCRFVPIASDETIVQDDSSIQKIFAMNGLKCTDKIQYHITGVHGIEAEYVGNIVE